MPAPNGLNSRASKKRKGQALQTNSHQTKLGRRQGLHVCKYCGRDMSQAVRIRCASCASFHLCLYCFSIGAELKQHKNSHPYMVHGDLSFPMYELSWGADEEMLLLEGIDDFGLGNWSAVSKHVGSKTAAECKQHYFTVYIRSSNFPLPQPSAEMEGKNPLQVAGEQKVAAEGSLEGVVAVSSAQEDADAELEETQDTGNVGALRPAGVSDIAQVDQGSEGLEAVPSIQPSGAVTQPKTEAIQSGSKAIDPSLAPPKKVRPGKADGGLSGPSGPKPDSVEQQQLSTRGLPSARPSNAAAQAGGPGEVGGKQPSDRARLEGYQPEISGFHAKRFEFDHEYDNDAELLISEIEFLPTDTPEEHKEKLQLVNIYNQRLSEREHRRSIVITQGLMDVRRQQAIERRQTPAERELHAQMRVFARYQSPSEHEQLVEGLLLEQRLRTRLQELKELRAAGVRTFEEAEEYEAKKRKQAEGSKPSDWSQRFAPRTSTDDLSGMLGSATPDNSGRIRELSRLRTSSSVASPPPAWLTKDLGNVASQLAVWRSRRGFALDITAFDGTDILSSKERHLCATERLLPHQYLAYKASLLREAEREGASFTRSHAKYMFRLRSPLALKIYDFLVSCNWIPGQPVQQPGELQIPEDEAYLSDNAQAAASPPRSNSKEVE